MLPMLVMSLYCEPVRFSHKQDAPPLTALTIEKVVLGKLSCLLGVIVPQSTPSLQYNTLQFTPYRLTVMKY